MSEREKPNYWAVLPATVRYDAKLPANAKLLYAEISALCDATGYCFASNGYFAQNFELNEKSISRLLKALSKKGYIVVDVVRDERTNEVLERRIFAGINPAGDAPPSPQFCGDPSPQKRGDPSPQNCYGEQSNSFNNIPPIVPQGGRGGRKGRKLRERPDWNPERFDKFWAYYPQKGRKDKQRAMDAWDKLKPSDELIDTIARALKKLKATREWREEIGIPHVATFLVNARWEDARELSQSISQSENTGGWAEDEEVL